MLPGSKAGPGDHAGRHADLAQRRRADPAALRPRGSHLHEGFLQLTEPGGLDDLCELRVDVEPLLDQLDLTDERCSQSQRPVTPTRAFTGSCCAAAAMRGRSVRRMTDNAEAAELQPSEELLAARALETGLVEEDETYIYTPDDLQDGDVAADHVWLQKGTGRKVYLVKKEQGPASQG